MEKENPLDRVGRSVLLEPRGALALVGSGVLDGQERVAHATTGRHEAGESRELPIGDHDRLIEVLPFLAVRDRTRRPDLAGARRRVRVLGEEVHPQSATALVPELDPLVARDEVGPLDPISIVDVHSADDQVGRVDGLDVGLPLHHQGDEVDDGQTCVGALPTRGVHLGQDRVDRLDCLSLLDLEEEVLCDLEVRVQDVARSCDGGTAVVVERMHTVGSTVGLRDATIEPFGVVLLVAVRTPDHDHSVVHADAMCVHVLQNPCFAQKSNGFPFEVGQLAHRLLPEWMF